MYVRLVVYFIYPVFTWRNKVTFGTSSSVQACRVIYEYDPSLQSKKKNVILLYVLRAKREKKKKNILSRQQKEFAAA